MQKTSLIPSEYQAMGLPLRWQDEQSGRLAAAVQAFHDERLHRQPMEPSQFELLHDYLVYYIEAPAWEMAALLSGHLTMEEVELLPVPLLQARLENVRSQVQDETTAENLTILTDLRAQAHRLDSPEMVDRWIRECLEIGVDPL